MWNHERNDCLLADFCDGSMYKKHDKTALQLQLYYDDLQICNPLGSRAKKHKIGNKLYYNNSDVICLLTCFLLHAG